MKAFENKKEKLNEDVAQKKIANGGIVEELDIESLNEVTGGGLKNGTFKTPTKDISGDTKAKI